MAVLGLVCCWLIKIHNLSDLICLLMRILLLLFLAADAFALVGPASRRSLLLCDVPAEIKPLLEQQFGDLSSLLYISADDEALAAYVPLVCFPAFARASRQGFPRRNRHSSKRADTRGRREIDVPVSGIGR